MDGYMVVYAISIFLFGVSAGAKFDRWLSNKLGHCWSGAPCRRKP